MGYYQNEKCRVWFSVSQGRALHMPLFSSLLFTTTTSSLKGALTAQLHSFSEWNHTKASAATLNQLHRLFWPSRQFKTVGSLNKMFKKVFNLNSFSYKTALYIINTPCLIPVTLQQFLINILISEKLLSIHFSSCERSLRCVSVHSGYSGD